jgi:hypothetical protein
MADPSGEDPSPAADATPHVPGKQASTVDVPGTDRSIPVRELDMGMRETTIDGETYAVVVDVHPLTRFLPPEIVDTLEATIEPGDESDRFGIHHLMASVGERHPEAVSMADVSDNGEVGYALVWLVAHDSHTLHEMVVELVLELMEHAVGHAEDESVQEAFESYREEFDVETFVEQYRSQRDFEDEDDTFA